MFYIRSDADMEARKLLEPWLKAQMTKIVRAAYKADWSKRNQAFIPPYGFSYATVDCCSTIELIDGTPTVVVTCSKSDSIEAHQRRLSGSGKRLPASSLEDYFKTVVHDWLRLTFSIDEVTA